jgi:hypothetical protein
VIRNVLAMPREVEQLLDSTSHRRSWPDRATRELDLLEPRNGYEWTGVFKIEVTVN